MRRPRHPMPADVKKALSAHGVVADHKARPDYQQNDYIGWIEGAAGAETRARRIGQMVNELAAGGVYMKMAHAPSEKPVRR